MPDAALRIFPDEYVPNAEGADYHRRWVKANPAEAAKWATFRNALIATGNGAVPVMATKYGKALVAAGKEHMSISRFVGAMVPAFPLPPPAPPPEPPSTFAKIGVGYMLFGNGGLPPTHVADYDMVLSSWAAGSLVGGSVARRGTIYMSAVSCKTGAGGAYHYGVTLEEAVANGWILKDSSGNDLVNTGYPASVGDLGLAAYQQRWCQNVEAKLNEWGVDGVFIDDVFRNYGGFSGGPQPVKYPTMTDWENANVSFAQAIYAYFNPLGKYVWYNATGYVGGLADSDTGKSDLDFWTLLAPYTHGLNCEYWQWRDSSVQGIRKLGPEWYNNWDGWQRLPALCETRGIDFYGMVYSTIAAQADYVVHSTLLETRGTVTWNPGGVTTQTEPWHTSWNRLLTLGNPVGLKFPSGVEWHRQYTGGTVWVDPVNGFSGII